MADPRDDMLREMARHRGFRLVKSRRRKPGGDHGRYGLTDLNSGQDCFGIGEAGLEASAEEIEAYLRGGARADWKRSLGAAGKAAASARPQKKKKREHASPPPPPARKPEPKPEPEPEPEPESEPELVIREAEAGDAAAIAALIGGGDVAKALRALIRSGEPPLVADKGGIVGCAAWHVIPALQHGPIGRLTLLAVAEDERRRVVGTALAEAVEERLAARGCAVLEVLSDIDLDNAHGFFRGRGYERTSYRFAKPQTKN